ncbi:hypothetical protein [Streptomyces avermitilis]|uniref:hypothetical protein n=1 Tax=Streptomyces avermitilis TaxID=33903 RepID=UPI0033A1FECC
MEDAVDHALSVEAEDSAAQGDGEDVCDNWPRLSRLCDRLTRARLARDRLHERAMPSPTEIRIKVEAAERMVARAEKCLASETEAHQKKLEKYELRVRQDRAAGRRGANGRPPVPMEHKTVLVRQRTRLAKMRAWQRFLATCTRICSLMPANRSLLLAAAAPIASRSEAIATSFATCALTCSLMSANRSLLLRAAAAIASRKGAIAASTDSFMPGRITRVKRGMGCCASPPDGSDSGRASPLSSGSGPDGCLVMYFM